MAYSEKLLDHYENPRNVGSMDKDDPSVGTGLVGAPACGDVMRLQIRVSAEGVIEDARFKTFGCGSAIASSSLATEWIKGKNIDEAATIKNSQIAEELSLPPVKIHCSVLAEDAIKSAIEDYKAKRAARVALNADASVAEPTALVLSRKRARVRARSPLISKDVPWKPPQPPTPQQLLLKPRSRGARSPSRTKPWSLPRRSSRSGALRMRRCVWA